MTIIYILVAVLIFGIIVLIHEFGHFAVAKWCGIKVNEFSIGMGPKLVSIKKGETAYSIRMLPLGGFVSMEGEDDSSSDPRAFRAKKVWQRLLVVLAGAFMNLVLGMVVLIILTSCQESVISTTVADFYEGAVSSQSGLQAGDKITKVNGMRIYTDTDISYQFQRDTDFTFEMEVLRNGEKVVLLAVKFGSNTYPDGTTSLIIDFRVVGEKVNLGSVLSYSGRKFCSVARMIWISLADLIKGNVSVNDLSGPVGIVGAIGEVVGSTQQGIPFGEMLANLASFVVFITINVGIFNLLPVPALDGSRAVFLIIEGIRRKPLKPEVEGIIHLVGMGALVLLFIVVTVSDIGKLF